MIQKSLFLKDLKNFKILKELHSDSEAATFTVKMTEASDPVQVKVKGLPWFCKVENGEFHYRICDEGKQVTVEILEHPAQKNHSDNKGHQVDETPVMFQNITGPQHLKNQKCHNWIDNLIGEAENEDIRIKDEDMVLARKTYSDKEFLTVIRKRGIKSLRDLNSSHLLLLRSVLKKSREYTAEELGVDPKKVNLYLHYPPSYWHLHIHCDSKTPEPSARIHFLEDIIKNIEYNSSYYQNATLKIIVNEDQEVFKNLKESRYFEAKKECAPWRRSAERNFTNMSNQSQSYRNFSGRRCQNRW